MPGGALLRVEDAGAGIPAADRDRVFAPFYRIAGDDQGAGLGLSLVRQIARLHGGDAVVAEGPVSGRPGFEIRLPRQA